MLDLLAFCRDVLVRQPAQVGPLVLDWITRCRLALRPLTQQTLESMKQIGSREHLQTNTTLVMEAMLTALCLDVGLIVKGH